MTKAELRARLRTGRRMFADGMSKKKKIACLDAIAANLAEAIGDEQSISAYFANSSEADPSAFVRKATEERRVVAMPFFEERAAMMQLKEWRPGEPLMIGPFGMHQPLRDAQDVIPAAVITPLVGFHRAGYRLGQGGGHYDRLFALHPELRRIGLAWSVQEVDHLDPDPWDMPLDAVVTECDIFRMDRKS